MSSFPITLSDDNDTESPSAGTPTTTGTTVRSIMTNPSLRQQARHLFFANIYVTEIIDHLQLHPTDIQNLTLLAFGPDGSGTDPNCWAYKRNNRPKSSPTTYEKVKPLLLKETEYKLMNRVRASVDAMEETNQLLSLSDMDKAVNMIERLDKITRLEEGKATEHIATISSYSLRDIARLQQASQQNTQQLPDTNQTITVQLPTNDHTTLTTKEPVYDDLVFSEGQAIRDPFAQDS